MSALLFALAAFWCRMNCEMKLSGSVSSNTRLKQFSCCSASVSFLLPLAFDVRFCSVDSVGFLFITAPFADMGFNLLTRSRICV